MNSAVEELYECIHACYVQCMEIYDECLCPRMKDLLDNMAAYREVCGHKCKTACHPSMSFHCQEGCLLTCAGLKTGNSALTTGNRLGIRTYTVFVGTETNGEASISDMEIYAV